MLGARRVVYRREGRAIPTPLWMAQRLAAVALGPLVVLHVAVPGAPRNPLVGWLLAAAILTHGFIAIWRLAGWSGLPRPAYRSAALGAFVVTALFTVLAVVVLLAL